MQSIRQKRSLPFLDQVPVQAGEVELRVAGETKAAWGSPGSDGESSSPVIRWLSLGSNDGTGITVQVEQGSKGCIVSKSQTSACLSFIPHCRQPSSLQYL